MALAALLLATSGPATAAAAYVAQFVAQSPYPTLEQGDTVELSFTFKNVGDQTWYRDGNAPVNLGASAPLDRSSAFYNPPDWISQGRPTSLDQAIVPPGANGTFTFVALAPAPTGVFREHFTPVAERVEWMTPGILHYLDFTVLPAQAPAVGITSAPSRLLPGEPIRVSADVTDNRGVARVSFEVGGQVVTRTAPTAGQTYEAELSSSALGAGSQTLVVRATDLGGRVAVATTTFEIVSTAPADADRDGVATPLDCNDGDPSIHPGITDVPEDGIDQDCTGSDAAFPELTATTTFSYEYLVRIVVRRIDVTRLKGGETVTVGCTGRRCPFATRRFAIRRAGALRLGRSLLHARRLPAGTRLTVRVSKPRTIGTYTSLTVRRGRPPAIARKCLRPGSNAPVRCP